MSCWQVLRQGSSVVAPLLRAGEARKTNSNSVTKNSLLASACRKSARTSQGERDGCKDAGQERRTYRGNAEAYLI